MKIKDINENVVQFGKHKERKAERDTELVRGYEEFMLKVRELGFMVSPDGEFGRALLEMGKESERKGLEHHLQSLKIVAHEIKMKRKKF